jgi:glycosyltransferase involved in cell wall biosynthesis
MTTYVLDARTVTPHFPGIGRYVANLAPALAAQLQADERLLVLHAPEARERLGGLAGPRVRLLATSVSPFSLGQQLQLPRLLRETGDVDLYHSTYYLMPYSMRLPTVLTFYDLIPLQHPETVSRRARLLFRLTMGMALGVSANVLSISEAARRDVLARFELPSERITTTPLAADARFCPQPTDEVARVRAAYDLPQEMVLFVGINKPHKNLVRLIDAFGRLLQQGSSATLVIAGPWDDRYPEAKAVAASMPGRLPGGLPTGESVRFLGPVADADLPALYAAATVFVLPSLYEGFGLPVLEAMACGAAVACSSTSSLPEIAGEAALTFDPQDVEAMAEAIGRLLDDEGLRQHMAQAGLVQAASFTWEKTAALTLAVYRQVLEQAVQGK